VEFYATIQRGRGFYSTRQNRRIESGCGDIRVGVFKATIPLDIWLRDHFRQNLFRSSIYTLKTSWLQVLQVLSAYGIS
jgi:hypothetical protein